MVEQTENIVGMRKKIKAQAEHVRRLEQRIRELKQAAPQPGQSEWVSAAERVPSEDDGEVLVLMADGRCEIAWVIYWHGASTNFACWTFCDPDEDQVPTHWMRLPSPPAQGAPQ